MGDDANETLREGALHFPIKKRTGNPGSGARDAISAHDG